MCQKRPVFSSKKKAYKNIVDFCHVVSKSLRTLFIILMLIGMYKGLSNNILMYLIIALDFALLSVILINMETGSVKVHA